MVARWLLCAALLLPLAAPAHAACRDDVQDLKPRIDRIKTASPARYFLALRWWGKAQEASTGSEVECFNYLARAQRSLNEQLPQVADCLGSNAYLPQCQNNAAPAVQPVTATAAGLGGPDGEAFAGNLGTVGSTQQTSNPQATGTSGGRQ
jgi:hypothetical protein